MKPSVFRKQASVFFTSLAGIFLSPLNATVLTFDIVGIADFQAIDQNYGDNVSSFSDGTFSYGSDGGLTPNITVSYGDTSPSLWTTGYGLLNNVLFENADSSGVLEITLKADPGYEVQLLNFDLAAFSNSFTVDPVIDLVELRDATSQVVASTNLAISKNTFTEIDASTSQLRSSELTIRVDARNLGNLNDDIGIDNITFSQISVVPEPSTYLLMGLGLALVGFYLRKRL